MERTLRNVRGTDATLILNVGAVEGGTKLTVAFCEQLTKPHRIVQLDDVAQCRDVDQIRAWLAGLRVIHLNVAGPRESTQGTAGRAGSRRRHAAKRGGQTTSSALRVL